MLLTKVASVKFIFLNAQGSKTQRGPASYGHAGDVFLAPTPGPPGGASKLGATSPPGVLILRSRGLGETEDPKSQWCTAGGPATAGPHPALLCKCSLNGTQPPMV